MNDLKISLEQRDGNFVKVADFNSINYIYGITNDGWLIIDNNDEYIVDFKSKSFLPFLKILEINFEEFRSSFEKSFIKYFENNDLLEQIFPLKKITMMVFESKSNYWSELCLNLLLKLNYEEDELLVYLKDLKKESWLNQRVKHKLFRIISPAGPSPSISK